ncbi:MAG: hypothetical protein DHS20C10_13550 [marine bacterium B5-7]|nr:MAG: hypothetical protein DHS20C10_13550 [marine bacterium B5-7]
MRKTAILFGFSCVLAFTACSEKPKQKPQAPKPQQIVAKPEYTKMGYCPAANTLRMTNMHWAAPGGWQTITPSFSKHITRFAGAQWKGYTNGKVACIYTGDSNDFDIALQTNQLVGEPAGMNWTASHKDQVGQQIYNCASNQPSNCGFPIAVKTWQDDSTPDIKPINLDEKVPVVGPQSTQL